MDIMLPGLTGRRLCWQRLNPKTGVEMWGHVQTTAGVPLSPKVPVEGSLLTLCMYVHICSLKLPLGGTSKVFVYTLLRPIRL